MESPNPIMIEYRDEYFVKDDEKDYVISSQHHTIDVIMARQIHAISHANITITDLKHQKRANWQAMVEILEDIVKLLEHSYSYEV